MLRFGAQCSHVLAVASEKLSAVALVIPAHTLKGEARQFGAEPLAEVAEREGYSRPEITDEFALEISERIDARSSQRWICASTAGWSTLPERRVS